MALPADNVRHRPRPLRDLLRLRTVLVIGAAAALAVGGTALALRPTGRSAAAQPPSVTALHLPGSPGNAAFSALGTSPPLPAAAATAPKAAVSAYLTARRQGNDRGSYTLLPAASHIRYPSLAQWSFALRDSPRPTSFTLTGRAVATTGGVAVTADLHQVPRLDPIAGFVPAHLSATYLAIKSTGGWQVQPDPIDGSAILPADRGAAEAAAAWLAARTKCDDRASRAVQASDRLLGAPDLAAAPCKVRGAWRSGAVERLEEGPAARPFTAAYGSGVGSWGRLVPMISPHGRFYAALAPLGERWRVFGLLADRTGG